MLALITGASTGIGQATALHLAARGWSVLAGVRDDAAGERLGELAKGPGRLEPLKLDVTDAQQIAAAAERVAQAQGASVAGGLDALVNNAGIGVGGPLELVSPEDMLRQFDVNVHGPVAVTQALLPALRRARGRILFTSSISGRVSTPYLAPYAASKHAIEAIGDALRVELRPFGVQVALIEPGSVATPIWDKGRADADRFSVPPALEQHYGHVAGALRKAIDDTEQRGVPAQEVADTIGRALSARSMRSRYVVGRDARAQLVLGALLPDKAFDRLKARFMGL